MKIVLALIASLVLAACANSQIRSIQFSGQSVITGMDDTFRHGIMPKVIPYSSIVTGCREPITAIETEVLEQTPNPGTNEKGQRTSGFIRERWTLSKCQQIVPIYISLEFLPDGTTAHELSTKP